MKYPCRLTRMILFSTALLGLLVTSAVGRQRNFEELAKQAAEARESEDLQKAITLYRQALELHSSWLEGWWYLGTILYDLDRYPEATDAFRRFVSLDPEAAPGWSLLGLCEFQTRQYDRALASLNQGRVLGLAGKDQLTYVAKYHLAVLMNRFEEFEEAFSILFALAREHYDSPKIKEALGISVLRLPFLPQELPADRREMILLAGRAALYSATFRIDGAKSSYEELVERYPDTANIHYAYGVFLLQANPDQALEEFRRELEISPLHVPAHLQIAFEYIRRDDPQAGLAYAEKAVELDPKSFAARNALGRILLAMDEIEQAIGQLETGLQLAPDSPEMHFALARAYSRAGRKEEAKRARQEFLRLNKIARTKREGPQSVGGTPVDVSEKPRRQD
ncbi:tetratricopeptide repeat protein [Acidobacteria bacterium AH-259-O06]|nr:tetratricopeptide repeat protein [Acidobacteria bacterium AH-259-O06]